MTRSSEAFRTVMAATLVLASCGDGSDTSDLPEPAPDEIAPAAVPASAPGGATPALADELLGSATFYVADLGSTPIRLRAGEWTDESTGRGATLVPSPRQRGDLDNDGDMEVAAVLVVAGTEGFDSYLVALGAGAGRATQEAIIPLGRMVTVTRMRMDGRALVLQTMRLPPVGQAPRPLQEERYLLDASGWTRLGS